MLFDGEGGDVVVGWRIVTGPVDDGAEVGELVSCDDGISEEEGVWDWGSGIHGCGVGISLESEGGVGGIDGIRDCTERSGEVAAGGKAGSGNHVGADAEGACIRADEAHSTDGILKGGGESVRGDAVVQNEATESEFRKALGDGIAFGLVANATITAAGDDQ